MPKFEVVESYLNNSDVGLLKRKSLRQIEVRIMGLKEGYIGKWSRYAKDEVKIRVARPSVLAPSERLLKRWKGGKIDWAEYERRFREEILSNPAVAKLREIKKLAEEKDVRLICYEKNPPCHRFILIDMVREL